MGSSFSDAHPAMSAHEQLRAPHACEQRIPSSQLLLLLLRRSTEPALVDGGVLCLGSCGVVAGDIVWVSCEQREHGVDGHMGALKNRKTRAAGEQEQVRCGCGCGAAVWMYVWMYRGV